VRNPTVKALFLEIAGQRERFAADMLPHAQRLGGPTESDGSFAGALHRGWMTIKDAVGGHEDAAIVREAERGERIALAAYEEALDGMVPPSVRDLLERQCADVRRATSGFTRPGLLTREPAGGYCRDWDYGIHSSRLACRR
jgi:uncharacterized protein (TIGR02284 family)